MGVLGGAGPSGRPLAIPVIFLNKKRLSFSTNDEPKCSNFFAWTLHVSRLKDAERLAEEARSGNTNI
eukprot:13384366-Heterocapsa_arctica.AAC.1